MLNCRKNSIMLLKGEQKQSLKEDSYISLLRKNGFDVTSIPVLEFHFVGLDHLQQALCNPDKYSCLLLTSPRAVEAIEKAISDKEQFESVWSKKLTFAVGSTTGKSAENIGLGVRGSESGNSENLAPVLIEEISSDSLLMSRPVLFPCGNIKLETLPGALQAVGIGIECITVYETMANLNLRQNLEEFIADQKFFPEYIVFYSPSGVNSAFRLLQQLGLLSNNVKLIAIGPTTEKAITAHDGNVWGTAAQPTPEQLLQLLCSSKRE